MENNPNHFSPENGLTSAAVAESRKLHGSNDLQLREERVLLNIIREIVTEPMFLLLLAACIIYFVVGQPQEGVIMLVAIGIVAGISLFQEYRSKNAVLALKKLSAPDARVLREGIITRIPVEEIVVGDRLLLSEGAVVGADGEISSANDFSVNESILTGESFAVVKSPDNDPAVKKGTLVISGSAVVVVTEVGSNTVFGKIGQSMQAIAVTKTPLQQQVRSFVRNMVWIGAIALLAVIGVNYYQTGNLVQSFLQGLTLAMSILPEEIPVAFSTFQALGAFRLLRNNIIVKLPQYVETLGSATVLCVDKTGTLTQNKMSIAYLYDAHTQLSIEMTPDAPVPASLIAYAMWSSETVPFDPMEKAIHQLYSKAISKDERSDYTQVHEYPIGGHPPMMTHVFSNKESKVIIAAKGAPEAILQHSPLPEAVKQQVEKQSTDYASLGYRVLAVGKGSWEGTNYPASQDAFQFELLGLLAFQDPPKPNIAETIDQFFRAGIPVKMITGDYAATALAIAGQVGLQNNGEVLTGKQVLDLSTAQLQQRVGEVAIYARMFPDAKLKVIEALKLNGEIVAMTGDGVNDGPALKAAHIGIAMGARGSEVAKAAASLVLTDDDLSHMTAAVALGRKIYDNLKKAIRYIVSIHIPIILIVTLPLLLGWRFTDIFYPVHVIFLELIMGPTCSIIYENEPMEPGTMLRPPRKMSASFLTFRQLSISIVQGLAITLGCLANGYHYLQMGVDDSVVRTVIFTTLLFSNIFLTLVNRSFRFTLFTTLGYRNNLVPLILGITLLLMAAILFIPAASEWFRLTPLPWTDLVQCAVVALLCTAWLDIWKVARRRNVVA